MAFVPVMCVVIVFFAGAIALYLKLETNEPDIVSKTVIENASLWVLWAIFSPFILILSRRFSFEYSRRLRSLLVHLPVGFVWAVIVQGLHLLLLFILKDLAIHNSEDLYRPYRDWVASLLPNMLIYWVIITINLIFLYYERYQNEMLKAAKLDAQLSNARLQALQMQLQPHFLFNTLHSISALALDNEIRDAVKMINRLSEFLRLTLDNADMQIVTLEDEIEFTRRYLEIEHIRFQDRLTIDMDIDPQTLAAEVPTLILQPLVENAMRHAVDCNAGTSRIQIAAYLQNDKVLMEVRDDGKDPKKISGQNEARGVGLKNTRARLSELYGEDCSFTLSRRENEWTVAQIVIPFIPAKEQSRGELN
jgi:sensor histidine kinase YesM